MHSGCVRIGEKTYKAISAARQDMDWFCKDCKEVITILKTAVNPNRNTSEVAANLKQLLDSASSPTVKSDKLQDLESRIKQHTLLLEEVSQKIGQLNEYSTPKINYAEVLKNEPMKKLVKQNRQKIIIKPIVAQENMDTRKELREKIDPAGMSVGILSMKDIKNGGILLVCHDEKDTTRVEEIMRKSLGNRYTVEIAKLNKPRMKLIGITERYESDEIIKKIKIQNQFLTDEDSIEVKYIKLQKNKTYTIFIEVNGSAFRKIIQHKKLNIGWDRCSVYEDISILRCFKCGQYGHKSGQCHNEEICSNCAGNHSTRNCKDDRKKCINCKLSSEKYKENLNTNHSAMDENCTIYMRKVKQLRERTDYHSNN